MATELADDRAVGVGALFGALGVVGALVMYIGAVGHDQIVAGWGFALAMTAGALLVAALHGYG